MKQLLISGRFGTCLADNLILRGTYRRKLSLLVNMDCRCKDSIIVLFGGLWLPSLSQMLHGDCH